MTSEEVTLDIEGTSIKCKKSVLVSNSDYFKAMFEGNFVEKNKNTIQLKDVDLKAMNIILTLIWDETYYIEDEDVLMVLETACMLQFDKIRNICLDKVIEILSVRNCLKIWIITEQLDFKVISLKAKFMALAEFMIIKETDTISELTLQQLCNYLGNTNLRTDNELSVFQTAMKWWYENCDSSVKELLKLLSCINFKSMQMDHFKEILTYPGIASTDVEKILNCLYSIINGIKSETFSEEVTDIAELLNKTKNRVVSSFPCILVKTPSNKYETRKGQILPNDMVLYIDKYQRKKHYEKLDANIKRGLHVAYFDHRFNKFQMFFPLKDKLEGFKLIGYKEYVFMYGGEYTLGRGDWNRGFWAYNTIKKRWQRKSALPSPRRHFETCIVDSKIFIVGGTGLYRINQENLFWYDFKEDKWSKEKSLPVFDRHIKCCNFMEKFFLFSITNSSGYFLGELESWTTIPVKIETHILDNKLGFSLFSYQNKLYIKGRKLTELIMTHNQLLVSSIREVTNRDYSRIETVVCNNLAFTLYSYSDNHSLEEGGSACTPSTFSLERYNLDTGDVDFVFENLNFIDATQTKENDFVIEETLLMFSFSHYSLMEGNDLVNEFF